VETDTSPRRQLETALIQKAWKDPEFRKEVVKDPKGTFEKATGKKLPAEARIIIHEEDANTIHFSIPPSPDQLSELSDEDLEKVAGGTEFVATLIALVGTAIFGTLSASVSATVTSAVTGKSPW